MTKEQYFEMCEMLGSEPIESEIPIEFGDLLLEVQEALQIYSNLQDSWDHMSGKYLGKNMVGFKDILDIFEVEPADRRYVYELVTTIDRIRAKNIADKIAKTEKPPK